MKQNLKMEAETFEKNKDKTWLEENIGSWKKSAVFLFCETENGLKILSDRWKKYGIQFYSKE